jgi:hypothetical protein
VEFPGPLRTLIFTFLSVKSHRLLGSASKQLRSDSQKQHSWPQRIRLLGPILGLHYAKQCDWEQAMLLLDAAPSSAEVDSIRGQLLLLQILDEPLNGRLLARRALQLFQSSAKAGYWWSQYYCAVMALLEFDAIHGKLGADEKFSANEHALRLFEPELQRRAATDDSVALFEVSRLLRTARRPCFGNAHAMLWIHSAVHKPLQKLRFPPAQLAEACALARTGCGLAAIARLTPLQSLMPLATVKLAEAIENREGVNDRSDALYLSAGVEWGCCAGLSRLDVRKPLASEAFRSGEAGGLLRSQQRAPHGWRPVHCGRHSGRQYRAEPDSCRAVYPSRCTVGRR